MNFGIAGGPGTSPSPILRDDYSPLQHGNVTHTPCTACLFLSPRFYLFSYVWDHWGSPGTDRKIVKWAGRHGELQLISQANGGGFYSAPIVPMGATQKGDPELPDLMILHESYDFHETFYI